MANVSASIDGALAGGKDSGIRDENVSSTFASARVSAGVTGDVLKAAIFVCMLVVATLDFGTFGDELAEPC